jgi:small GTP-binding protein
MIKLNNHLFHISKTMKVYKIIMIGDSGCGKTSLIQQYVNRRFSANYSSTIGIDFLCKDVFINNQWYTLQIFDTASQERFKSLGKSFFRGADGTLLVCSVTNPISVENLFVWKEEFLAVCNPAKPDSFPFVVIANKIDLNESRTVSTRVLNDWSLRNLIPLYEASAKENFNVTVAFNDLVKRSVAYNDLWDHPEEKVIVIEKEKDEGRRCGC